MKLLTYLTSDNEQRAAFIHNNKAVDLEDFGQVANFPLPSTILELIDMGFEVIAEINSLLEDISEAELAEISYNLDRKSTRLNSSHVRISYAVFCLKKKKKKK